MQAFLLRLFEHMAWADARLVEGLRSAEQPVGRARMLLGHVLGAERVWLSRLIGEAEPIAVWPDLSLEECARLAARNAAEMRGWIEGLEPAALARDVAYTNSRGQSYRNTVQDILTHVALHGAYHRGQIAAVLREAGIDPPSTDYIVWLRE